MKITPVVGMSVVIAQLPTAKVERVGPACAAASDCLSRPRAASVLGVSALGHTKTLEDSLMEPTDENPRMATGTGDATWVMTNVLLNKLKAGDTLIHGCARGADTLAATLAAGMDGVDIEATPLSEHCILRCRPGETNNARYGRDLVLAFHNDLSKSGAQPIWFGVLARPESRLKYSGGKQTSRPSDSKRPIGSERRPLK